MSGLGQKVKEILHKDRSNDDATPHPPGSFPTEDMEPSDTIEGYSKKYEHNKLHKADDPRGWTESDKDASRSHGYKDSGLGMTGSEDRTSYKPGQENMSERRDESFGDRRDDTLGGRRNDTLLGGRRDDALDRTTESSTMGQKNPLAPSTEEHPYWGDLPSQGGVHNSVIGHGSPEDEARRHRDVHSGATEATHNPSSTLESGTFLNRRDRDDSTRNTDPNAARPGEQMRPDERTSGSHYKEGLAGTGAAGAGAYGAHKLNESRDRDETLGGNTEPYGSRPGDQTRPDERTSDSHYKEGLAGAGAAGAGAYGAHKLNERRHDKDEPRQYDQATDRTQPEEHKQRAFPLLGKDHKEPKEHHHHEKVKDDKEKDSKLGGLFHRKDKDDAERVGDYDNDKHHHSKTGPALGAAGAAGAAGAYAATRDRHDDDNRRDNTARNYQDPSATQHTTKYPAAGLDSSRDYNTQGTNPSSGGAPQMPYRQEDIDSHRGRNIATGAAGGAAAGLGAGALASHYGRRDDDRTANQRGSGFDNQSYDPSATSQQPGSQHIHGLSAAAVADDRYDSQSNQPTNFSHKDPMGQNQQHDSHRGAGLAAGTAAGLGAAGLASRSGRDHDRDDRSGLESNRGYENQSAYPTEGSAMKPSSRNYDQKHDSHRGTGMAAGTAAGLGAAGLASHAGRDHDRNERSGLGSNQGFQSQDPYSSERSAMNPGSQSYEQQDSHRGTGLGAGTAAGLGAGALASRAGRDHDEKSGLGSNRGFNSQDPYSSERSAMNPGSQDAYSSERSAMNPGSEQRDTHRGAGLATGAAAGLGAGALASHAGDHRRENDQFNTGDNNRGFQSQSGMTGTGLGNQMGENTGFGNQSSMTGMGQNTGLGNQSGMTENTGMMGNTSGLGNTTGNAFSNKQSMPGAQPQRESEPFTERKKEHDHTLMDNANAGKYNKLSSGTPSGIAYD